MTIRRSILQSIAFLLACPAAALAADPAASYPARPVTIVVPFAPGQSADILARMLGEALGKKWGKPVVVENNGGAGGAVGSLIVARARPDGYTLLMGSTGPTSIAPQLSKAAAYDPRKDFAAVIALAGVPQMMLVPANSPYKSMQDVIDDARRNPGKLSYGTGGTGSLAHLTMEMFQHRAGIRLQHIPYKGAGPAYTDLLAGRLQLMFDTTPAAIGFVRAGQLRFLAASTATRTDAAPGVPTVAEAGLPGFEVQGWLGVVAPAGLDPALQSRLNRDFAQVMEEPGIRRKLADLGMSPIGGSAQDFQAFIASEYRKFADVIRTAGISAD
ncbi:tripartite tricarboxylate transporter substrate binding protein [Pigmentiphaga soli]|uniref:Tripartite tricarboxylate transporter substrate binding protein n=1 Tax=Pigmentiphaga soli TaxID=1007095 RepID=A0ABP8GWX9_9BURK